MLTIGAIGAALYYFKDTFIQPEKILAVSQVTLDPQGSLQSDGSWSGSYWTILTTTDMRDQYDAITLDNSTVQNAQAYRIGSNTITPTNTIQIRIIPGIPYYERSLNIAGWQVYPKTQTWVRNKITAATTLGDPSVPELDVQVWQWGQGSWTAHAPYTIEVRKNGQIWATKSFDAKGVSDTQIIINPTNPKENVTISNVAVLGSGYGEPQLGNILLLSQNAVFQYSDSLAKAISFNQATFGTNNDPTFANYWFGGKYGTTNYPGWKGASDFWNYIYQPLQADIWTDHTAGQGGFTKTGLSLYSWLTQTRGFTPLSSNQLNVYGSGWAVTNNQDPNNAGYIQEIMPKGAMSSLITIQISTDLAGAIVNRPPVSQAKITGLHWQGQANGQSANIGDTQTLYVDLQQQSAITSTVDVYATSTSGQNIALTPTSQKIDMQPNSNTEVAINVLNNGAQQIQNGQITITLKNELGTVTDTRTISYSLQPKGVGNSQLIVYTQDKETNQLISGIQVAVAWGQNSKTYTSGTNGAGAFSINLEGYQETAVLTSVENDQYNSATQTIQISLGPNTATLQIEPKTAKSTADYTIYIILAAAIAIIIAVVAVAAYAAKKHH